MNQGSSSIRAEENDEDIGAGTESDHNDHDDQETPLLQSNANQDISSEYTPITSTSNNSSKKRKQPAFTANDKRKKVEAQKLLIESTNEILHQYRLEVMK